MSHTLDQLIRRHKEATRLKGALKRAGITQDRVAAEAGVGRTMVVHLLAGRCESARVVQIIKRLLAQKGAA